LCEYHSSRFLKQGHGRFLGSLRGHELLVFTRDRSQICLTLPACRRGRFEADSRPRIRSLDESEADHFLDCVP
jgi:hypothetical protein